MPEQENVLVMTNAPDLLLAKHIAHILIEEKLAACVNIGPSVLSVYRWNDGIEGAEEIPLLIKTTANLQQAIIARIVALHPYEVPEVIVIPIIGGGSQYLNWIRHATHGGQQ